MVKVAVIGYGFMGKTHFAAWQKLRGAKVVAICDVNLAQLKAKNLGNVPEAKQDVAIGADIRVWENLDEMLAAGGIDVVDITLPTPLHAPVVLKALAAGCHVLCEKPMALTLRECDQMLAAAKKAGKVFLIAQCVRFFPAYLKLTELIRSGKYGKVVAADFGRFMAPPKWSPKGGSWLLDESKSGGLYVDAHIHDADYIASLFGLPQRVTSHATRGDGRALSRPSKPGKGDAPSYTRHLTTHYEYADGKVVTSDCSFAASDALGFDATAKVFLEKATIYLGGKGESPLCVYPEGGKPFSPKLATASGYEAEIAYFLKLVQGKAPNPQTLTAEDARNALKLVLAERKSAETGRPVVV